MFHARLVKYHPVFFRNKCATDEDSGHKWTLGAALRRMKVDGVDTKCMFSVFISESFLTVQKS